MEWGSGGGANLVDLVPYAANLYAVDVSTKNLEESCRQVRAVGGNCLPVQVAERPADVAAAVLAPLDVFFSSAVFHLLPSKPYAAGVVRTAFSTMKPGALGYIQIRYDDGNPKYAPRGASRYRTDHVYAMSWGLAEFWGELMNAGFSPIKIANLNTTANFAAFYFRK